VRRRPCRHAVAGADRLDVLTVRAERRPDATRSAAKGAIGVTIRVEVAAPGEVERSAGKMRRVVDER
jgi:phenylacetate-CoA ligase